MADIRLLERTLAQNVTWNRARINFVAKFLVALIQVKSVNLSEVASVFAGGALKESHYKRIQRFLRSFELPYAAVAAFVLRLLGVPAPWARTLEAPMVSDDALNSLVLGVSIGVLPAVLHPGGGSCREGVLREGSQWDAPAQSAICDRCRGAGSLDRLVKDYAKRGRSRLCSDV